MYKHGASQNINPRDTARGVYTIDKHQDDIDECKNRDTDMIMTIKENINVCEERLENVLDLQINWREVEVEVDDATSLYV